ncbi:cysteine methyltransferase [Luteipulveratus mongoliensis]|uniref:Methylated-DNA--protein-cysteine methyltransferase n=2 Tax=Luteipulveratus mongoliensis TaxID=571913 RepID=A0A0K1JRP5_9MICO|nr:methylated-DNA--[protein]-cysteine S-methyltransferase [Luteipulveratus mongoliensis]AKU19220.1 cysteine methyltransferase [Luteipulveratus mongoliensis]
MNKRHHLIKGTLIGDVTIVLEGDGLVAVYMTEHRHAPDRSTFGPVVEDDALAETVEIQLRAYLAGERDDFDLPLAPHGTPFQQKVWQALLQIPYGETVTYGELAARIGSPAASRAVGLANGRNPISVIVPCHRVIGADGSLTGYGGGLERKQALLELEREHAAATLV